MWSTWYVSFRWIVMLMVKYFKKFDCLFRVMGCVKCSGRIMSYVKYIRGAVGGWARQTGRPLGWLPCISDERWPIREGPENNLFRFRSQDIDWVQTEKHVFETASNHPFLVGLHSCFQTPSRLFFVIEFVRGGDLMFHMQRQRRLPEEHARFYAAEISLALNFLHDKGN